jgi:hypothetical protein
MKEITGRRKKFDAAFWRENFKLFLDTLEQHDRVINEKDDLNKIVNRTNSSDRKNRILSEKLNEFSHDISDQCWQHFLKRVRDIKYEESKKRKRISISEKHYSRISRFAKKHGFESPNNLLGQILSNLNDSDIKKLKSK